MGVIIATFAGLSPIVAHAQSGVYPYLHSNYDRGTLASTKEQDGVVFERYQGSFTSKNEQRWM
ncbi:MAG: hypothetical protein EON59_17205 [Alphaproteobacteria bacterium]|nr:MAG: hypothetical protein EON59_17205 [Alphaproteobacteria bacterium]